MQRFEILALASGLLLSMPLRAQCPDGSARPCARPGIRTPSPNSVAVLYFDNLSRDTADAYLADGLTEEIIVRLGQIQRLDVKSRYEVQRFRGRPTGDPSILGRSLSAANVVSGSVQKAGGPVRVRVELVRATNRSRLWGDVFDRTSDDVLAIEEEIARAVVQEIAGRLMPEERAALERRPTASAAAYDLYLRGRTLVTRRDEPSLRRAIGLFEQALAIDTGFALANAGIAQAWVTLADDWVAPREAYPLARIAASRALHADSSTAEAWANLAAVAFWYEWASARAESLGRRAIALDPRLSWAHMVRGRALGSLTAAEEAAKELHLAFDLDSLSEQTATEAAGGLWLLRRYDEAAALARRFQRAIPASAVGYLNEAQVYLLQGDCDRALPLLAHVRTVIDNDPYSAVAESHCRGDDDAARRLISERVQSWEKSRVYFRAGLVAWMYMLLGDRDDALTWLERAFDAREGTLNTLESPRWDAVRDDPRFVSLVRRADVAPALEH